MIKRKKRCPPSPISNLGSALFFPVQMGDQLIGNKQVDVTSSNLFTPAPLMRTCKKKGGGLEFN